MGLFEKKYCDLCGEKIGLLGNKKLEDGNMCGNCQKKLSPWFSGRRHTSVEDIRAQLAYREENKKQVAAFAVTRSFGSAAKLLIDDNTKQFIVTRSNRWQDENPDVIRFDQVTGCETNIDEDKDELMTKDAEGKERSYIPPRYQYTYSFDVTLHVDHPYFDEMKFKPVSDVREQTPERGNLAKIVHGEAYQTAEETLKGIEAFCREARGELAEEPQEAPAAQAEETTAATV